MRRQMIDVSIYWEDKDGAYKCQLPNGERLKWLDESDVEAIIGKRMMASFMAGHRDFRGDMLVITDYFVRQKETAQRIIASHNKVYTAAI